MGLIRVKLPTIMSEAGLVAFPPYLVKEMQRIGGVSKDITNIGVPAYYDNIFSGWLFINTFSPNSDSFLLEFSPSILKDVSTRQPVLASAVFYDDFETLEGYTIDGVNDEASYAVQNSILTMTSPTNEPGADLIIYKTTDADLLTNTSIFAIMKIIKNQTKGGGPLCFYLQGRVGNLTGRGRLACFGVNDNDKYGVLDWGVCGDTVVSYDLANRNDNNDWFMLKFEFVNNFSGAKMHFYQGYQLLAEGTVSFSCSFSLDVSTLALVVSYAMETISVDAVWIVNNNNIATDVKPALPIYYIPKPRPVE